MNAALDAVPAASTAITIPLMLTVALATVSLVVVAVLVRRARRAGRLTRVSATASGVSAVGIVASTLLLTVAFGGAATATAAPSIPAASPLSGYQLPTK